MAVEGQAGSEGGGAGTTPPKQEAGAVGKVWPLKVDGKDLTLTEDEVKAAAQKHLSAQGARQEVEELRKKLADAEKFYEKAVAFRDKGDMEAYREIGRFFNASPEQIEASLAATGGNKAAGGGDAGKGEGGESPSIDEIVAAVVAKMAPAVSGPVTLDRLDPKLRKALVGWAKHDVEAGVDKALDNDAVLGKIMKTASESRKQAIRKMAQREVQGRVRQGDDVLAGEGLQEALQAVRASLIELGIGSDSTTPPMTGLGGAPGGTGVLHPTGDPVKRPAGGVEDPAYTTYLLDKIARGLAAKQG